MMSTPTGTRRWRASIGCSTRRASRRTSPAIARRRSTTRRFPTSRRTPAADDVYALLLETFRRPRLQRRRSGQADLPIPIEFGPAPTFGSGASSTRSWRGRSPAGRPRALPCAAAGLSRRPLRTGVPRGSDRLPHRPSGGRLSSPSRVSPVRASRSEALAADVPSTPGEAGDTTRRHAALSRGRRRRRALQADVLPGARRPRLRAVKVVPSGPLDAGVSESGCAHGAGIPTDAPAATERYASSSTWRRSRRSCAISFDRCRGSAARSADRNKVGTDPHPAPAARRLTDTHPGPQRGAAY